MNDTAFRRIIDKVLKMVQSQLKNITSTVCFGTVVKINKTTLEIEQIYVDAHGITLPDTFFEVGDNCRRRIYEGDRVRLLQFNNYQKYYIAEVLRDDPILCYGTVKTAFPNKLSIEVGDFGVLTEEWFITGQMMNDRVTVGDTVMLISVNKGKQYYVAEVMADDPNLCEATFKGNDDEHDFIDIDRVGNRPKKYFWYLKDDYFDGWEQGHRLLLLSCNKGRHYYILSGPWNPADMPKTGFHPPLY